MSKRTTRKPLSTPEVAQGPDKDVLPIGAILQDEKTASEKGIAVLERCIAAAEKMLASGDYDAQVASHLAWILGQRSQVMERLRRFGEKVSAQTLKLTPEQQRRALIKYFQMQPGDLKREIRDLLDASIDDITIVTM